jgi:hypothetical protein
MADSQSQRKFLGLSWQEQTPNYSTLSIMRRPLAEGLMSGETLGVGATTLEAIASLLIGVARSDGAGYAEHVQLLLKNEAVAEPKTFERQRLDRKRKKSLTKRDWMNPHAPESWIPKRMHACTHLAHKAEHTVNLATGALLALSVQRETARSPQA